MLKARLAGLTAAAALVGAWSSAPSPASADVPIVSVGWWTRSPAAPAAPERGIGVGTAPDGQLSVAAIKVDVEGGATAAAIKLTEADGQGAAAATLQACSTTDNWTPASGGDLGQAPRADCASPVNLTRASDGTWSGDLFPLLSGKTGSATVMIVPGPAAAGVPGATAAAFQISFAPPTIDGSVTASSSLSNDGTTGGAAGDTSSPSSDSFSSGSGTLSPSSGAAPNFAPPDLGSAAALATGPAVAPAPSAAAQAPPAAPTSANQPFVPFKPAPGGTAKRAISALTVIAWLFLALLIGAAAAGIRWARDEGRIPGLGGGRRVFQPPPAV